MKESVFQQLLQIGAHQQSIYFYWRDAARAQCLDIHYLRPAYELKRQDPGASVCPVNFWNTNGPPGAKVVAKAIRITTFLHIVHLLKNGRMKLAEHAFPIGVFIRPGKEPVHQFYETIKYGDIETDYAFEVGTLNFDGDFFAREQTRAINL